MYETIRNILSVLIILCLVFGGGYILGDRQRASKDRDARNQLERELGEAGSAIEELTAQNERARNYINDIENKLNGAREIVTELDGILQSDTDSISGIIQLLRDIREKIAELKALYYSNDFIVEP